MRKSISRSVASAFAALFLTASITPFMADDAWAIRIFKKDNRPAIDIPAGAGVVVIQRNFTLNQQGNVAITYSAECAVVSLNNEVNLRVQVIIDSAIFQPATRILCTDTEGTSTGPSSHSFTVVANLQPGEHVLEVQANAISGDPGAEAPVGNQNLTLIVQKN